MEQVPQVYNLPTTWKNQTTNLVLEKSQKAGSFLEKFPRHRKLISTNKVYTGFTDPEVNLRWEWNSLLSDDQELRMAHYTKNYFPEADHLVKYFNDFASKFNLNIKYDKEVVHVDKGNDVFIVSIRDDQTFHTKRLIVGTGVFKPYTPKIPGIELCENYVDCSINVDDFKNKRVLILGKGNSAFEMADHLVGAASLIHVASPNPLKFAWDTHFVGHLRAVNNNLLDTYQLKSQNAIIDARVMKIERHGEKLHVDFSYAHANGEEETIVYDKALVATGFRFDHAIFSERIKPELDFNDRFPRQTEEWESTNVPGLFFVGVLSQQRDYKKSTSAFIHGF